MVKVRKNLVSFIFDCLIHQFSIFFFSGFWHSFITLLNLKSPQSSLGRGGANALAGVTAVIYCVALRFTFSVPGTNSLSCSDLQVKRFLFHPKSMSCCEP